MDEQVLTEMIRTSRGDDKMIDGVWLTQNLAWAAQHLQWGKFGTLCEMVRSMGDDSHQEITATMHLLLLK